MHLLSLMILPLPSGLNTIIQPLPQPLCTDIIARFVSVTSKMDAHGANFSVDEWDIALDTTMLQ